ncbi:hypothetical protein P3T76_000609 [Phytophthora citrophthora]|uniref:Uncharacterized protein n=1 Tax=Phytophthora citrophthora TaxID=4793 RepID=A0AAD9H0Y9_9STRA|nr:hypothetical protein P3T76_000609 [Phytophthora citrophthora]
MKLEEVVPAGASAQLARVADRSPLLLPLASANCNALHHIVVKIRPTLLHFLVSSRLQCVIRSKMPITDVTEHSNDPAEMDPQVSVSTADGNVWIVSLPGHLQSRAGAVCRELLLERPSSGNNDGSVQWFCQLPGVQSVHYTPGLTALTLMRSLVTPSTLIVSERGSSRSKLQRHQSLELDEIEGEQSTCVLCLNSHVEKHTGILKSLFPDVEKYTDVAAILQGDLDGCVRFSLVHFPTSKGKIAKASVIRNGTLLQLGEPTQMIIPFTTFNPSEADNVALVPQLFDALLILGARGRVGIVDLKTGCSVEALPVSLKTMELRCSVQSLVFVSSLAAFIFCSNGVAFVCRVTDLLAKAQLADAESSASIGDTSKVYAEKLPFQPGVVRLAIHDKARRISILFASGRITTVDKSALRTMVDSVLPLSGQERPIENSMQETRVRNILQHIAQVSAKSSALRDHSKDMDYQLKSLHSALEILRQIETSGVESVVKCELGASMTIAGAFSDRLSVKLMCSLRFVNLEAIISLDDWLLCLYVRTRHRAVTTYSFPLNEVATRKEQSVILDPDTLTQQDQGVLWVSCSMAFCPSTHGYQEAKHDETMDAGLKSMDSRNPLSLAIPLQDRRFLLAQLSQPIEEETSLRQVAVHAAFRQNHDPVMSANRADSEGKEAPSLWTGGQWWAALADHAQKNPSFAALWSKIVPSDAASLTLSPPSRFLLSIPSFFAAEDEYDDDEEEDNEKVRVEKMVLFLRQILEIPIEEVPRLRRCCRTQNGKLWIVLRAFSGSLILLRFAPSEDQQRSVDLTIQCSDVADLSAMRALVLDAINNWGDGGPPGISDEERSEELALDMDEVLEPISALEKLLEELKLTTKSIGAPESDACTDEVLHALSQLAYLETQTLSLYWKTRVQLNKTIM